MIRRDFMKIAINTIGAGALVRSGWAQVAANPRSGQSNVTLDLTAFHAARRFADTSFGKIAYVERGSGDAALFLHGLPLNGFQWRGALERLSPFRRCVAPDFMGLGYTQVAAGQGVSPAAQVAMLAAFLDKLGISSVDVIANDSGGAVAQLFLARYPERVRTLLLTNCDTEHECPPAALLPVIDMSLAGTFVDKFFVNWLADKKIARSKEGLGTCYAEPVRLIDETIDCYLAPIISTPERKALFHAYAIALQYNVLNGVEAALKGSNAPTRIVWGMADTIFSPGNPDYLDHTFGNSRGVRRLEGSRLFWPEERPDVIASEARSLWGVA